MLYPVQFTEPWPFCLPTVSLVLIHPRPTSLLAKGYIQSPWFDGRGPYPTAMDAWLRLDVPAGHDVMISVPRFHVGSQMLGQSTDKLEVKSDSLSVFLSVTGAIYTSKTFPPVLT